MDAILDKVKTEFQSTHPRGVRHVLVMDDIYKDAFQSTHPRGVRLLGDTLYPYFDVSIHAPTWGATICKKH